MSELNVKDLVDMARDFQKSKFGEWYLAQLNQREAACIEAAMRSAVVDQKAVYIEHAAGLREATNLIRYYIELSEQPELLEKMTSQEEKPVKT